jgi:hypothetical protein
MKKTTLILAAVLLTAIVNAQWYANQYGVTDMNELNKEQLDLSLTQATKLKKAGVATTVVSSIVMIVGTVMYSNSLNNMTVDSYYDDMSKGYKGAGIVTIGALGTCVGIPMWISGAQRVNVINVHLAKFDQLGYNQYGVGISLTF